MSELAFIDWLRARTPAGERVLLGPGDDTALVRTGSELLVTADMLLEGSCFTLEGSPIQVPGVAPASAFRVGRKAMAVNLSDIAAMAGVPLFAVVSVGLPRRGGRALAEELYRGMRDMADLFGVSIVGGDTNTWDGPLSINVTLLGEPGAGGVVRRKGARVGDRLFVTGPLGGSLAGHHLDFVPRVREALALAEAATLRAMIDLSDGLALDLSRLCAESGVGAVLRSVPCNPGCSLEQALGGGEDFELLFAAAPVDVPALRATGVALHEVGEAVASGLWLERDGQREPLPALGYEHRME
ncbi:MAG: thiamine-phosphate kinase [Gemmataceae bacterium]|nr:thiamine-phosphate kinase [Gemmataceae bacterium]